MSTREFHYQAGMSAKFWRITVDGPACTVQFGRIGTPGQTQTKTFPDAQAAQVASSKQIAEKLNKGYREVGGAQNSQHSARSLLGRVAAAVRSKIAPSTAAQAQPSAPPLDEQPTTPNPRPASRTKKIRRTDAPSVYDPTVRLNLDPQDWFWATWRRSAPLERPAAAPFDRADALQRLRHLSNSRHYWLWKWEQVIPEAVTPEEAIFWLYARHTANQHYQTHWSYKSLNSAQFANQLATSDPNPQHLREQAFAIVVDAPFRPQQILMALLVALFSPQEIMERLMQAYEGSYKSNVTLLVEGFRQSVLPYLSHDERDQLSQALTPHLKHACSYTGLHPALYFAAMLGGHNDPLLKLVQSWDAQTCGANTQQLQEIIFGLDDPREVEAQIRRLGLRLNDPRYIRGWIAHTEDRALDVVCASIQAESDRESAGALSKTFALVAAPAAAPHMLRLTQDSKAPQVASAWIDKHPAHTIAGLLPVADGRDAQARAAAELLRRLVRRGYGAQIEQALAALPADTADRLRAHVITGAEPSLPPFDEQTTPAWLDEALRSLPTAKPAKLPVWARPSELPPITVGTHVLSPEQLEAVLRSVQSAKTDAPNALISALKQHAGRAALDHFVWSLFERWLAEGAPSKDNWAFFGLGVLGGDATALKLAPLIRAWPGEGQHQRAANGLECLRRIGSDTALMQINSIAQNVKFKGMQKRAMECMNQIAEQRGLSREQLDDRIVPDCELDARGERIFDYGPRQFRFVLGPEMKPMLRDPQGKLRSNLPAATTKDDAEKVAQASADWKLLKQQVAVVARMEAARLEHAMGAGRRWTLPEFETLLARHPLLTHLVQALIWGAYDATGTLSATFRVTEDRSYADSADQTVELAAAARIGLIHPLDVSDDERAAWGEILGDYAIVQPFPQLGRPIHRLGAHEQQTTDITRFNDLPIPARKLIFGLDRRGWKRDLPDASVHFCGHFKHFYQANLTAVIQYSAGVTPYGVVDAPEQTITYIAFMPGLLQAECKPEHTARLPLGTVDPVVISEALTDILALVASGK